jgi:hypothetical protein
MAEEHGCGAGLPVECDLQDGDCLGGLRGERSSEERAEQKQAKDASSEGESAEREEMHGWKKRRSRDE